MFLVRFVTTHTKTKIKWHRHSAVCNSKWKAKLLKHSNSDSDAVHNNAHPALGSQTRVDPSAARPRTVAVQDVEPFCALSFGSVATQSVPETSAFSNGPNLNFWRSSHSPQVAAHLPPWSSDSPAPPRPCWTRNTTSHVQFREERKLLLWLLWSLGVNQLVTQRARLTQEFGRVARRTNCSGRTCFASFTPAPERKKDDFEALRKIISAKMEKICWQITVAAFMQPLQYDLRSPAAKDNSITNAATARSNLDVAITMRSAETDLQNTIELRATASERISTPERKKDDFEALFKRIFRRKIISAKMEKICWQITVAAFMQPLQYDLRSPAAKDNSITNAATAQSNLDAAIYTAGTILQLQITMEFHRQLIHQQHLQSHLHCGNDPTVANHNGILSTAHARKTLETPFTMRNRSDHGPTMVRHRSEHDPTTHETVSHPSHRRGRSSTFGDALCLEKHTVSCICYLSKTHFVRDFLQNSIGNSSTRTTCNPIYSKGTISLLTLSVTNSFPH